MGPSEYGRAERRVHIRQQEVTAELSQQALAADDTDRLLREAAVAVTETLDADFCGVFEAVPGEGEALLRSGVGWREGVTGYATVPTGRGTQTGDALSQGEPILVDDLDDDDRFSGSELLTGHGVDSGITTSIGPVDDPWGVLGVYTTERREFGEHDSAFVGSVANVLASAIEPEPVQGECREVYDRISDAFFALDTDWRFTYLNERAHEFINPEGRTLVGKNVWEEFPEAIGRKFKSKYEQETVSFEEYYPEPLDSWFEVRAYPSETGLSVYFRDVTERKERERELERYRTIVETANDGVYTVDQDGRFTMVNEAYAEMTGYPREELIGADVSLVVDEGIASAAQAYEEDLVAGDQPNPVLEADLRTAGGETVPTEAKFALLSPDEEGYERAGVVRDITERKERERTLEETIADLEESNERLESFASMLAHELRNPVAIGQIYSQQLPTDEAPEAVERVTEAFDRIERMVEVMLMLTRDSDALEERSPVSLETVAREAWDGVDAPDATLEVMIDCTVRADETYVRHLFRNLFENAVEHGGGGVTITAGELPTGFYVADDGPGIPPDDRSSVFDEGYTTAAKRGGTGLGLAFVRRLAGIYGWECRVTESATGGARFEFLNVHHESHRS